MTTAYFSVELSNTARLDAPSSTSLPSEVPSLSSEPSRLSSTKMFLGLLILTSVTASSSKAATKAKLSVPFRKV